MAENIVHAKTTVQLLAISRFHRQVAHFGSSRIAANTSKSASIERKSNFTQSSVLLIQYPLATYHVHDYFGEGVLPNSFSVSRSALYGFYPRLRRRGIGVRDVLLHQMSRDQPSECLPDLAHSKAPLATLPGLRL